MAKPRKPKSDSNGVTHTIEFKLTNMSCLLTIKANSVTEALEKFNEINDHGEAMLRDPSLEVLTNYDLQVISVTRIDP